MMTALILLMVVYATLNGINAYYVRKDLREIRPKLTEARADNQLLWRDVKMQARAHAADIEALNKRIARHDERMGFN
jgi:hypothetical protein